MEKDVYYREAFTYYKFLQVEVAFNIGEAGEEVMRLKAVLTLFLRKASSTKMYRSYLDFNISFFLFLHQKGAIIRGKAIIRGRRLFQIFLTEGRALNNLFYYAIK